MCDSARECVMDDILQRPIIYFIAWDVIWLLVGYLRLLRYVGYFQSEGYDNRRYFVWFRHHIAKQRYLPLSLVVSAIGLFAVFWVLFVNDIGAILSGISSVIFAVLTFCVEPRDHSLKMQFVATPR